MATLYMIVGRLVNQKTYLSQVRLYEYAKGRTIWVDERQLLHLQATGNKIVNMDTICNGEYDVPNYQLVGGQRRLIDDSKPSKGVALAIVTRGEHKSVGLLLLRAPSRFIFVRMGDTFDSVENIANLNMSNEVESVLGQYSIGYKDYLPILDTSSLIKIKGLEVRTIKRKAQ